MLTFTPIIRHPDHRRFCAVPWKSYCQGSTVHNRFRCLKQKPSTLWFIWPWATQRRCNSCRMGVHIKHFVTIKIERCRRLVFWSGSLTTLTSFVLSDKPPWFRDYCDLILKYLPSIHWHCLCKTIEAKFEDSVKNFRDYGWLGRKEWRLLMNGSCIIFYSKRRCWFQVWFMFLVWPFYFTCSWQYATKRKLHQSVSASKPV